MPVFIAVSTKAAITTGALIGGAIAIIANNERFLEIAAGALQKGAEVLSKRAERKHRVACRLGMTDDWEDGLEDESYQEYEEDSDATTPSSTDMEHSDMGENDNGEISDGSDTIGDDDIDSIDIDDIYENRPSVRRRSKADELIVDDVD